MGNTSQRMRERSETVDRFVRETWATAIAAERREKSCLVAVGGYGRQELFPYSDVDLLIVEQPGTFAAGELSDFIRILWDAGYRASHSVHTVAECKRITQGNVELNVSLLDRRLLDGAAGLYQTLDEACRKAPSGLAMELSTMARRRHERFQSTIQHLEPDVKEGPGGLRDLNVLRWLEKLGVEVAPDLEAEAEVLYEIRWALHELAGRDQNVLRFAEQDAMTDTPEQWMRRFFRAARKIYSACRNELEKVIDHRPGLASSFFERRARLSNEEFTVVRDQLLLRNPAGFATDPQAPHRLFLMQGRHGVRLAPDTKTRLGHSAIWTWAQWKELLELPHAAQALRGMAESGVLSKQLPEWEHIDCLVVRDFHHRYTVDEHTLIALENLEGIGNESRQFAALWAACESKAVLRFALLLHDTGKGLGGDHDRRSVEFAEATAERIGMGKEDRQLVFRLIADHLYLSTLMTTRDLDDPATAEQAGHKVETEEFLRMLTLLTYADSSAVHPGAMTAWRRTQLWHANLVVERELRKELEDDRIAPAEQAGPLGEFLSGFPTRYWFRTNEVERQHHHTLAQGATVLGVSTELVKKQDNWQLTVVTRDRARLLADLAGTLASFGMNILRAEAFRNARGEILDVFVFSDPLHSLELNPPVVDELKDAVQKVVLGKENVEKLLKRRYRPSPKYVQRVDPVLRFDNDTSQTATLLEMVAQDRPGLLYDVARTISSENCIIDTVLLNTEGQRAMDVFYLRSGGAKLLPEQVEGLRKKLAAVTAA